MTPTIFLICRSNQPVPTGLCQIKRGASHHRHDHLEQHSSIRPMEDGTGSPMRISSHRHALACGSSALRRSGAPPTWSYFHWGVRLRPARPRRFRRRSHASLHALSAGLDRVGHHHRLPARRGHRLLRRDVLAQRPSGYNQAYFPGRITTTSWVSSWAKDRSDAHESFSSAE